MAATKEIVLSGKHTIDLDRLPVLTVDPEKLAKRAKEIEITDHATYIKAVALVTEAETVVANIKAQFDDDRDKAFKLHRAFTGVIAKHCEPFAAIRPLLEPAIKGYVAEQERIARQRAQEEERKRREEQAKADAEARRIQEDAAKAAADLRRQGEMSAARKLSEQASQQAQLIQETAAVAAMDVIPVDTTPKVGGLSTSFPWKGELIQPDGLIRLIRAIAKNPDLLYVTMKVRGKPGQLDRVPLLDVNSAALTEIAKRLGQENLGIDGIRGVRDVTLGFKKGAAATAEAAPNLNTDDWDL